MIGDRRNKYHQMQQVGNQDAGDENILKLNKRRDGQQLEPLANQVRTNSFPRMMDTSNELNLHPIS